MIWSRSSTCWAREALCPDPWGGWAGVPGDPSKAWDPEGCTLLCGVSPCVGQARGCVCHRGACPGLHNTLGGKQNHVTELNPLCLISGRLSLEGGILQVWPPCGCRRRPASIHRQRPGVQTRQRAGRAGGRHSFSGAPWPGLFLPPQLPPGSQQVWQRLGADGWAEEEGRGTAAPIHTCCRCVTAEALVLGVGKPTGESSWEHLSSRALGSSATGGQGLLEKVPGFLESVVFPDQGLHS